ncbi:MAG: hypothetical protein HY747_10415 [Elusimicrobia bacterium]|nr:hypothetical protein [Elusimicrobiota bacterium]
MVGAFFLEISGYLAFPYLSLQLRDHFGFTPAQIGQILMLAIWIRPLATLAGGALSMRLRPLTLFSGACLAEGACFLLLGGADHAFWAIFAIIIGNIGFSIWKPNLFALAYNEKDGRSSTSKIALLNGVLNAGAASGCLLSAIIIHLNVSMVFLASGILYPLLIPLFIPSLSLEQIPQTAPLNAPSSFKREVLPSLLQRETFALILATVGFWASYNQFNSFFSLFAKDWLLNPSWTGAAFAAVTILVALFSLALARWHILSSKLHWLTAIFVVLFALSWMAMVSWNNIPSVIFYIVLISICETLFSVLLADSWGKLISAKKHLMQSLNFAFRSFGMGAGGFLGGWLYRSPAQSGSLLNWGIQNVALLAISLFGVLFSYRLFTGGARDGA